MVWVVLISAGLLLAAGSAMAYVFGAAAVLTFLAADKTRYLAVLPQRIFSQIDVFALMAMALFIMVGEIMNRTGVTKSLVSFSMSLVGRFRGGLGHVNILSSVFFAGVSGSAVADAAALSNTLVPAMIQRGYSRVYAGAITAASAVIGPIIPPSIILIFYGALMQTSIGGLFAGGILPGLILAAVLMATNGVLARRHNHPGGRGEEKLDQVAQGLLEISNSDLAKAGQLDPTIFGFYLPFLYEDMAHFFRTLDNSDVLATINNGTTKKGVRVLSIVPLGGMVGIATTKKFIKTPADFQGIRMRALDAKQAKWLEVWGANSVIIPWTEIYNSLQTGVADGYMNPAFVPFMFKHTEVLKYFSVANLAPALRTALCSEEWYKSLPDNDRAIVDEGAAAANSAVKAWVFESDQAAIEDLKAAGMQVYMNTAEDKAKFAGMIKPQYDDIVGPELAKFFTEAADKNR